MEYQVRACHVHGEIVLCFKMESDGVNREQFHVFQIPYGDWQRGQPVTSQVQMAQLCQVTDLWWNFLQVGVREIQMGEVGELPNKGREFFEVPIVAEIQVSQVG